MFFVFFWGLEGLGRIRDVGQLVQVEPVGSVFAVEVVDPVADAVLLVESGASAAHVGNATAVLIAHVEEHALELLVGVEAQRTVGTVEIQRHVRELLPPFGAVQGRQGVNQSGRERHDNGEQNCLAHHFNSNLFLNLKEKLRISGRWGNGMG